MPFDVQWVPNDDRLDRLVGRATSSLWISSPFVTADGVRIAMRSSVRPRLLTKVTAANLASKALDGKSLIRLLESGAEVRSIPNLHAKIYLIDGREGVVTSSNLTGPGLFRNVELGIHFTDEDQLYEAVRSVFDKLWQRATSVTVDSLAALDRSAQGVVFDRGVWRDKEPADAGEPQTVAPAIGFLQVAEPVDVQGPDGRTDDANTVLPEKQDQEDRRGKDQGPFAPDESGDVLAPLPPMGGHLIGMLSSSEPLAVQAALNAVGLTSASDFRRWLQSLSEPDFSPLVAPSNPYPYKSRVVERIIRDGSPSTYLAVSRTLTGDPGNETQLMKYLPALKARLATDRTEAVETVVPGLLDLAKYLSGLPTDSTAGAKNFNRPNLDRVCSLLTGTDFGPEVAEAVRGIQEEGVRPSAPAAAGVPAFQEIKRARESMGDSFRDYFTRHLPAIESGEWDAHLSSLLSLFKELTKVTLGPDGQEEVRLLAGRVRGRIDAEAARQRGLLVPELDRWEAAVDRGWRATHQSHLDAARAELAPAGQQAVRATGRLIALYGQWVKVRHAPANKDLKRLLDWLTTYLSVRNTLNVWVEGTARKKK